MRFVFIVLAAVLFSVGITFAQSTKLSGTVTDAESGEALPGANVIVSNVENQTGAATNVDGFFQVRNMVPGVYTVDISYIGYKRKIVTEVTVAAGEEKSLDAALAITGIAINPIAVSASRRAEKTMEAPASISVLEAREITTEVGTSSSSILRNVTGVDVSTTGVDRKEIVLRGFNNAFSGATYVLTDYRQAASPSIGVNLHSTMPNMTIDLDKVEIVRGPGSALYGAGVDAGVVHYLTKDPFNYPGTSVNFTLGERETLAGQFRHAASVGKLGYKITGQYAQANDFRLNPNNSLDQAQLASDAIDGDGAPLNPRNNDFQKVNVNAMLQYRLDDKTSLTSQVGFSQLDATVLSGIGTLQADGFGYSYGQLRLQSGSFFAQAYINRNDAGDSFVYGTGQNVIDNSTLVNLQAQYDLELMDGKEQIIFGVDYDRTTPDTEGTIYGRNEGNDLISETGAYAQSLTKLNSVFNLTLGLRGDYNNVQEKVQISPRLALVAKPNAQNSFRASYNRAFSSPGNNSLFLDIAGSTTSFGGSENRRLIVQGRGSKDGFTFNDFRENGTVKFFIPVDLGNGNNLFGMMLPLNSYPVAPAYGATATGFATALENGDIPDALKKNFTTAQLGSIANLLGVVAVSTSPLKTVTGILGIPDDTKTFGYKPVSGPQDISPLKQTITQTLETGYKGLFLENFLLAADVYYTNKKNFIGPLLTTSPFAYINPANIAEDVTQIITTGLQNGDPTITALVNTLGGSDALETVVIPTLTGIIAQTPTGVVQPDQQVLPTEDPTAVGGFLAYRNFGNVDLWGMDLALQVLLSDNLSIFGNYSFVSDNLFDNKELDEDNADLVLALNAPANKAKFGFHYSVPFSWSFNSSARFVKGFPVRSGPYLGDVDDYFVLDIGVGYDLGRTSPGMRFDISIQNLLNNEHREFIGAPQIGRIGMARVSYAL